MKKVKSLSTADIVHVLEQWCSKNAAALADAAPAAAGADGAVAEAAEAVRVVPEEHEVPPEEEM